MKLDLFEQLRNLDDLQENENVTAVMKQKKTCEDLYSDYNIRLLDPTSILGDFGRRYADGLRYYALIQPAKEMSVTITKLNNLHEAHPDDQQITLDLALALFYQFHKQSAGGWKLKTLKKIMDLEKENPENADLSLLVSHGKITSATHGIQKGYGLRQSLKEVAARMQRFADNQDFRTLFVLNLLYLDEEGDPTESGEKMMANASSVLAENWSIGKLAKELAVVYHRPILRMQKKALLVLRALADLHSQDQEAVLAYATVLADEEGIFSGMTLPERVEKLRSLAISFPDNEALTGQYARVLVQQAVSLKKADQNQIIASLERFRQRFPQSETIAAALAQTLVIHSARSNKQQILESYRVMEPLVRAFPDSLQLIRAFLKFLEKHHVSLPDQERQKAYLLAQKLPASLDSEDEAVTSFIQLKRAVLRKREDSYDRIQAPIREAFAHAAHPDEKLRIAILEKVLKDNPQNQEAAAALSRAPYYYGSSASKPEKQMIIDRLWLLHDQFPLDEEIVHALVFLTEDLFQEVHFLKQRLLERSMEELTDQFAGNPDIEEKILKMMLPVLDNAEYNSTATRLFQQIQAMTDSRNRRFMNNKIAQAGSLLIMIQQAAIQQAHQCYDKLCEMARPAGILEIQEDILRNAATTLISRDLTEPEEARQAGFDPQETFNKAIQEDPKTIETLYSWFLDGIGSSSLEEQIQAHRTLMDLCQKDPDNKALSLLTLSAMVIQADERMIDDDSAFLEDGWTLYQRYPDDALFILGMAGVAAGCAIFTVQRSQQIQEELSRHLPAHFRELLGPSAFLIQDAVLRDMQENFNAPRSQILNQTKRVNKLERELIVKTEFEDLLEDAVYANPQHPFNEKDDAMIVLTKAITYSDHPLKDYLPDGWMDSNYFF